LKRVLAVLVALVLAPLAHAAELDAEQHARYASMIAELRCLVCQNQSIAESNAPLAADLREQVEKQIAAGRSDAQIKSYLTDRYGDFVLYSPPFKRVTVLLWAGPSLLLLIGFAAAIRYARRARAPSAAPDAAQLARLLDEER
jgi:cytochrome c-type biogenesis protein CcmH